MARLWSPPADTARTLASQGLDLLGQQLVLVAVAQLTPTSIAPAPDGSAGGEGEVVAASSQHSDHAPLHHGLDLLGQQLGLPVAVAQLAPASIAPAPNSTVGGEGEAVSDSSRHSDDAPAASKGLDLLRQRLVLLVAVAKPAKASTSPALQTVPSAMRARLCPSPTATLTARSPPSGEGRRVGVLSRATPSPCPSSPGA